MKASGSDFAEGAASGKIADRLNVEAGESAGGWVQEFGAHGGEFRGQLQAHAREDARGFAL